MRKNILALSIAAIGGMVISGAAVAGVQATATGTNPESLPTAATATNLAIASDGTGHILMVPYYSVQNGNATLINIVNTDKSFGKAVKVRFRGAANSDDVFDFQVFLSPGDVWSANISKGADGRAALTTTDKSCTLPKNVNTSFVTDRLPSTYTAAQKALQTTEGYIEIFNMGDIPKSRYTTAQAGLAPTTSSTPAGTVDNPLYQAIKHVGGVAPCNSTDAAVAAQAAATLARTAVDTTVHDDSTIESNAAYQGLGLPTTGLFANWTIVNVPGTLTWTGEATAIVATSNGGSAAVGNLVMHPQTNALVAAGVAAARTSDPLLAGGYRVIDNLGVSSTAVAAPIQAALFDFPDLSTPYVVSAPATPVLPIGQAVQLTQALAATSFTNEYLTEPTINAKTDWVFSSPTRRYSVGLNYEIVSPDTTFTRVFQDLGGEDETYLYTGNTSVDTSLGQICVLNINPTYQDREENVPVDVTDFVISPGALGAPLTFCGEVSVLSFNNTAGTSVLGAEVARKDIDLLYRNGWATIATPGNDGKGLAVIGAAFMSAFNGSATPGVSGNYGLSFQHRYQRVAPAAAPF